MCAKSLKAAQHIKKLIVTNPEYTDRFEEGVLVGGVMSSEVHLSQMDIDLIMSCPSLPSVLSDMALSFRSLWKPHQTPSGMLYRKGEHVILLDDANEQHVCQVECFLCLEVDGKSFKAVKVLKYSKALDEEGSPMTDPYSGGLVVNIITNVQVLIAPVKAILSKAILYSNDDDARPGMKTVLDFQRERMPITFHDIHVPFLPQVHDMIMIKGDDPDPWLAKVLTIQERSKTAKVWYYMEDVGRPGEQLYVPYRDMRQAQDVVSWDSILWAAIGEWRGDAWFMG